MTFQETEAEFRNRIQGTFNRIEAPFEDVDPDVAECDQSLGSLTITFPDGARCILSTQPSVRQLWLALASKGIAFHFNYDASARAWMDDKGRGIELLSYLEKFFKDAAGLELKF